MPAIAAPTSEPSSSPHAWLACCQLANRPRRPGGACSARKTVAVPTSPPAEKPCASRATTMMAGAHAPMAA
jgi:hypothetical protein